jgi:hypothetical protein
MRLRKDIADRFHEFVVVIFGKEIHELNNHWVTNARRVTYLCSCIDSSDALRSLKNASTSIVGGSLVASAYIASSISSILSTPAS